MSPPASRRLPAALAPSALERAVREARARTPALLDLTVSNPTRVGLAAPRELLREALTAAPLERYEPAPQGLLAAREAVCGYYEAAHGRAVHPDDVLLTASTSEGYALLFKLLCDPGDAVLAPAPSYPLFEHLAALEGVRLASYPLRFDGARWCIDLAALEEQCAGTPEARAVLLVSPHNPTGARTRPHELDALRALCGRYGLALVSDEVFADFPLETRDRAAAPSLADERAAPCFVLSGLSKACALPQLKLGWIALAGPDEARALYRPRLELLCDTYLSVSAAAQHACAPLLARREALAGPVRARCEANLRALRALVAERPGAATTALPVEAGWSAVLRVPSVQSDEAWVRGALERARVLVQPGYFYDFEREGLLVLSLLPEEPVFSEGVTRLLEYVEGALS